MTEESFFDLATWYTPQTAGLWDFVITWIFCTALYMAAVEGFAAARKKEVPKQQMKWFRVIGVLLGLTTTLILLTQYEFSLSGLGGANIVPVMFGLLAWWLSYGAMKRWEWAKEQPFVALGFSFAIGAMVMGWMMTGFGTGLGKDLWTLVILLVLAAMLMSGKMFSYEGPGGERKWYPGEGGPPQWIGDWVQKSKEPESLTKAVDQTQWLSSAYMAAIHEVIEAKKNAENAKKAAVDAIDKVEKEAAQDGSDHWKVQKVKESVEAAVEACTVFFSQVNQGLVGAFEKLQKTHQAYKRAGITALNLASERGLAFNASLRSWEHDLHSVNSVVKSAVRAAQNVTRGVSDLSTQGNQLQQDGSNVFNEVIITANRIKKSLEGVAFGGIDFSRVNVQEAQDTLVHALQGQAAAVPPAPAATPAPSQPPARQQQSSSDPAAPPASRRSDSLSPDELVAKLEKIEESARELSGDALKKKVGEFIDVLEQLGSDHTISLKEWTVITKMASTMVDKVDDAEQFKTELNAARGSKKPVEIAKVFKDHPLRP